MSYTQQGVSVLFQRLKSKAKVPRPANILADKEEQAKYKKNFAARITGKNHYFQDEMRFGRRTELGRKWTTEWRTKDRQ